jgi:hypothetical protein
VATAFSPARGEAGILTRLVRPDEPTLSPAACRSILALKFSREDRSRMHQLAVKGQDDTLTADERAELEDYRRVGLLLSLLKAKARKSLKNGRRRS